MNSSGLEHEEKGGNDCKSWFHMKLSSGAQRPLGLDLNSFIISWGTILIISESVV
jgi:hypothetical protein